MFLRARTRTRTRRKDGKTHRYWSIVENRRVRGNCTVQRQVLYLGEINDSQHAAWQRTIEVFADGQSGPKQLALFAEGAAVPASKHEVVQIRLGDLPLHRPRQWAGVGWPRCCGISWRSTPSGRRFCRSAARAHAGSMF